jgi:hypothetical protein
MQQISSQLNLLGSSSGSSEQPGGCLKILMLNLFSGIAQLKLLYVEVCTETDATF